MDSCVCEKAVTTTQLAHRGVDLYKILGGKWKNLSTTTGITRFTSGHPHVKQPDLVYITVKNVSLTTYIQWIFTAYSILVSKMTNSKILQNFFPAN